MRLPPTAFATSVPKLALVPLLWPPSIFVLRLALRFECRGGSEAASAHSVASTAFVPPLTLSSVCAAMELPTLNNSKPRRSYYYSLVRFYWNEQIGLKFDMTPPSYLLHSVDLSCAYHRAAQGNLRRASPLTILWPITKYPWKYQINFW